MLFLHEAQVDHCDPLTVIEVVTNHFRDRCLRQHLLTVSQHLHRREARELANEDTGSRFGDHTEDVDDKGQDNNNTTFATILDVLQCDSSRPDDLVLLCGNKASKFLSLAIKEQRPMFAILATCCLQPLGWPDIDSSADVSVRTMVQKIQLQAWLVWLAIQVPWSGDTAPLAGVPPPQEISDLTQGVYQCLVARQEQDPHAFCASKDGDAMEAVLGLISLLVENHLTTVLNSFRIFAPGHLLFHLYLGVHAFFQRAYDRCGDCLRRFMAVVQLQRDGADAEKSGNEGGKHDDRTGENGVGVTMDSGGIAANAISLIRMEKFCECEIDRVLQRALRRRDAFDCSQWVELVAETG